MCLPPPAPNGQRCWERSRMRETSGPGLRTSHLGLAAFGFRLLFLLSRALTTCLSLGLLFLSVSCSTKPDPNTLVMIIESSPTNLDPRVGIDAQSERIDNLIFDDLLSRGNDLNLA